VGVTIRHFARLAFEVPIGPADADESRRHVEARLDTVQGLGLARLVAGLERSEATLRDGTRPQSGADAVRWLLEQLGGELEG